MDPVRELGYFRTLRAGNNDQFKVKQNKDKVIDAAFAGSTTYGSTFNVLETKIKAAPYWKDTQYILRMFGSQYCLKYTPLVYQFMFALYEEQNPFRALIAFKDMMAAHNCVIDTKFYEFCGNLLNLALFTKNPDSVTPFIVEALQLFDPQCAQKIMNEALKTLVIFSKSPTTAYEMSIIFWIRQGADIYMKFPLRREDRAIVNDLTKEGTLIHYCFIQKYPHLMRLLIQKQFDLSKLNHWSFVHEMAKKEEFKPLITLWMNIYKNIDIKDIEGNTLLHLALHNKDKDLALLLLGAGAKLLANNRGETPLHVDELEDPQVAAAIIAKNPHAAKQKDKFGKTPLHRQSTHLEYYKTLLTGCVDVNIPCHAGLCPIHVQKKLPIIQMLVAKGADLGAEDSDGRTTIHHLHELSVYKYLFEECSIDINQKDNKGQTPIINLFRKDPNEWGKIIEYLAWVGGEIDLESQATIMKEYFATDSVNCLELFRYYPIDWTKKLPFDENMEITPFEYVWNYVPQKLGVFLEKYDSKKLEESFISYMRHQTCHNLEVYQKITERLVINPQPVLKKYLAHAADAIGDCKLLIEAAKSKKEDKQKDSLFTIAWKENLSLATLEFILHKNPWLPNQTVFDMCWETRMLNRSNEKYQKNSALLKYIFANYSFPSEVRHHLVERDDIQNTDLFDFIIMNEVKAETALGKEKYLWEACLKKSPDHVMRLLVSQLPYQPYLVQAMHYGINEEHRELMAEAKKKGINLKAEGKVLLELAIKQHKQKAIAYLIELGVDASECLAEAIDSRNFSLAAHLIKSGASLSPRSSNAARIFNLVINSIHSNEAHRKEFLKAFFKDYPYIVPIIDFHSIPQLKHEIENFLNNQHLEPAVIVPSKGEGSLFDLIYLFDLMDSLAMPVANQLSNFQIALALDRLIGYLPQDKWQEVLENIFVMQTDHMKRGKIIEELPVVILPIMEMKKAYRKFVEEGPAILKTKDILPKNMGLNSSQELSKETVLANLDQFFRLVEAKSVPVFKPNTPMTPRLEKFAEQIKIPLLLQMLLNLLNAGHKDALGFTYLLSIPGNGYGMTINELCTYALMEANLAFFEKAFDPARNPHLEINAIKDDGQETTKEKMKDGLKRLSLGVIRREAVTGTSQTDSAELEIYYGKLQRTLMEVCQMMLQSEDPHAANFCIQELSLAGIHCGGRWMGVAVQQKMLLMNVELPTFQDAIYEELRMIRYSMLQSVFTERLRSLSDFNREHSVHIFNQLLGRVGEDLGLHNVRQFQGYSDAYNQRNLNVNEVKLQFFSRYHLANMTKQVLDSIAGMYKNPYKRDILTNWINENLPPEYENNFHGFHENLLYNEETNKFRIGFILYVMLEEDIIRKLGNL